MVKKILFSAALALTLLFTTHDEGLAKLPRDYQEFKERYQEEGQTIEGAAHLYFEAVFCYLNKKTRAEGGKMLRYAMRLHKPLEQSQNYRTFIDRLKDPSYHHIFRSFAVGTSPENSYEMSPDDFELEMVSQKEEDTFTHLYLQSSGADSPRSIWMEEHDGLWYTINNASTYVQVREPQKALDARRNAHDADYDKPVSPRKRAK